LGVATADGTASAMSQVAVVGLGTSVLSSFFFEAAGAGSNSFEGATDSFYFKSDSSTNVGAVFNAYMESTLGGSVLTAVELDVSGTLNTDDSGLRFMCPLSNDRMFVAYYSAGSGPVMGYYNSSGGWTVLNTDEQSSNKSPYACNYTQATGEGDNSVWISTKTGELARLDTDTGVLTTVDLTASGFEQNSNVMYPGVVGGVWFGSGKEGSLVLPMVRTRSGSYVAIGPSSTSNQYFRGGVPAGDGTGDIIVQVDDKAAGTGYVAMYRINPVNGTQTRISGLGSYFNNMVSDAFAQHEGFVVTTGQNNTDISIAHAGFAGTDTGNRGLRIYNPATDELSFAPFYWMSSAFAQPTNFISTDAGLLI